MIFRREKQVIDFVKQQTDMVADCLKITREMLATYFEGNPGAAAILALKFDEMETTADRIKQDILAKLCKGTFLPALRKDIYDIVVSINQVAKAAGNCCELFMDQRPDIPEYLEMQFQRLTATVYTGIQPLRKILPFYLKENVNQVELCASMQAMGKFTVEVKKLKRELNRDIFSSSLEPWHKIQLSRCADAISGISVLAVNSTERVELLLNNLI
jgi:predicted phosphate transport protein (TIGR00153 family)